MGWGDLLHNCRASERHMGSAVTLQNRGRGQEERKTPAPPREAEDIRKGQRPLGARALRGPRSVSSTTQLPSSACPRSHRLPWRQPDNTAEQGQGSKLPRRTLAQLRKSQTLAITWAPPLRQKQGCRRSYREGSELDANGKKVEIQG